MATRVIVLNGGSSSGKSGIARCLQAVLPDPWLALGVDTLIRAMPVSSRRSVAGIEFAPDGAVIVAPQFRALEAAWIEGVAAMAHAGARIIVDEVFLGGAASQQRWKKALSELPVLWVGVRCDSAVAAGREIARGDRVAGQAASQADTVHQGVAYDLQVDTTRTEGMRAGDRRLRAVSGGRGPGSQVRTGQAPCFAAMFHGKPSVSGPRSRGRSTSWRVGVPRVSRQATAPAKHRPDPIPSATR